MEFEEFFSCLAVATIMFLIFLLIDKSTSTQNFKYNIHNINTSYHTNSYSFDDKDNIIFVDEHDHQVIVTKPYVIEISQ